MGLDEDAVDLFAVHDPDLVAHGLDQGTQAEVAGAAQQAIAGTDDQGQGLGTEGMVLQIGAIQLAQDQRFDGFRSQAGQDHRAGHAGADFLVDGQSQGLEQRRLADEHQVVGVGKVLAGLWVSSLTDMD